MSLSICYVLYKEFISEGEKADDRQKVYIKYFYIISIIIPLLMGVIPIITQSYGSDEEYHIQICYISTYHPNGVKHPSHSQKLTSQIELIMIIIVPFVVVQIFNIYAIIRMKKKMSDTKREYAIDQQQLNFINYMFLFPIILFFCWIFHMIRVVCIILEANIFKDKVYGVIDSTISNLFSMILIILFIKLMIKYSNYQPELEYQESLHSELLGTYDDISVTSASNQMSIARRSFMRQQQQNLQSSYIQKSHITTNKRSSSNESLGIKNDLMLNNKSNFINKRSKLKGNQFFQSAVQYQNDFRISDSKHKNSEEYKNRSNPSIHEQQQNQKCDVETNSSRDGSDISINSNLNNSENQLKKNNQQITNLTKNQRNKQ